MAYTAPLDLIVRRAVEVVKSTEWYGQSAPQHVRALSADGRAGLSYDPVTVGGEMLQLLNLLFGNISLRAGILVTEIAIPPALLAHFAGPAFGIEGMRALCGSRERRPLLCAALKPLGFLCIVDRVRDRPQPASEDELRVVRDHRPRSGRS